MPISRLHIQSRCLLSANSEDTTDASMQELAVPFRLKDSPRSRATHVVLCQAAHKSTNKAASSVQFLTRGGIRWVAKRGCLAFAWQGKQVIDDAVFGQSRCARCASCGGPLLLARYDSPLCECSVICMQYARLQLCAFEPVRRLPLDPLAQM